MERVATGILYLITLFIFSSCHFNGIATRAEETYTSRYNFPGQHTVPYNDPAVIDKSAMEDLKVCKGKPSKKGFKCKK